MAKEGIRKVVVIGTGYVGLPLSIALARNGYQVVGVDINRQVVRAINEGILHIAEEDLKAIFQERPVRDNLIAQETPCEADAFVIAVPTPLDKRKEVCDLSHVISAVNSITPYLRKGNLVIIESTVPPLTCRETIAPLIEKQTGLKVGGDIHLAHCPERVLPGNIFFEIENNDRVIGGLTKEAASLARELYISFVKGSIYLTDDVTAEFCKLAENTYRDVNIALANELALVAETLGIEVTTAIELANRHPRVKILNPGIGVGGHCIPIDPWFLKEVDPKNTSVILAARRVNDRMPSVVAGKIRRAVKEIVDPKIVTLGMTYKPETYDLRESPALEIVRELREDGYDVHSYDPLVEGHGYSSISDIAENADLLVVLVPHKPIVNELSSDGERIKERMRTPRIMRP
jgi:UDP-N-acetyl-D-mannosaminuronic acid dehydrogenase